MSLLQALLTRLGMPELALDLLECSDVEPGIWSVVPDQSYWLLLARTAKVYSIRCAAWGVQCMLRCKGAAADGGGCHAAPTAGNDRFVCTL